MSRKMLAAITTRGVGALAEPIEVVDRERAEDA
jgi:hypothetical protein